MSDYKKEYKEATQRVSKFYSMLPKFAKGFAETVEEFYGESDALDYKTRELVILGIAIARQCEPCMLEHVQQLIKAGGTREEVAEVSALSMLMGGGPGLSYGSKALDMFDEFSK
ncbi:MAG TPA: carboxymuconolactone decarboxylase family protein [Clostridia bacterium]|nr:carboxymuconolactone decarboxylase family protein [Clostridia bacterium]